MQCLTWCHNGRRQGGSSSAKIKHNQIRLLSPSTHIKETDKSLPFNILASIKKEKKWIGKLNQILENRKIMSRSFSCVKLNTLLPMDEAQLCARGNIWPAIPQPCILGCNQSLRARTQQHTTGFWGMYTCTVHNFRILAEWLLFGEYI